MNMAYMRTLSFAAYLEHVKVEGLEDCGGGGEGYHAVGHFFLLALLKNTTFSILKLVFLPRHSFRREATTKNHFRPSDASIRTL